MSTITLGIVGTRHKVDQRVLVAAAQAAEAGVWDRWLKITETIVSGGEKNQERGVDAFAATYAVERRFALTEFPQSVEQGSFTERCHARNQKIADASDVLLAIPCQHSRGTYDTINRFVRKPGNELRVLYVQHVTCEEGA